MDNNLNDQITENSEGEEKSPSSYTDPNAGYTEAEPQAKNDNSVPKEAADDNLKQEEKSHPAYTYGEMPKSENGSGYCDFNPCIMHNCDCYYYKLEISSYRNAEIYKSNYAIYLWTGIGIFDQSISGKHTEDFE